MCSDVFLARFRSVATLDIPANTTASRAGEETDLAEEISGLEPVDLDPVAPHLGLAVEQDVELSPGLALANQLLARRELELARDPRDRRKVSASEPPRRAGRA
jgi:hypothetical protein